MVFLSIAFTFLMESKCFVEVNEKLIEEVIGIVWTFTNLKLLCLTPSCLNSNNSKT